MSRKGGDATMILIAVRETCNTEENAWNNTTDIVII